MKYSILLVILVSTTLLVSCVAKNESTASLSTSHGGSTGVVTTPEKQKPEYSPIGIHQSGDLVLPKYNKSDFIDTRMGLIHRSFIEVYVKNDSSSSFEDWVIKNGWSVRGYYRSANLYTIDTLSTNEDSILEALEKTFTSGYVTSVKPIGGMMRSSH